jgi:AcrR family transcriptional regulator
VSKTKQEVVTEFRCTEILDAARKVFAEKGFSETTMDQVAECAGIAKGTLYLYFRSKRDIYMAALMEGIRSLNNDSRRKVEAAAGVREKLRAFIETRVGYFEQHRDFFLIYHSEVGNLRVPQATHEGQMSELYLEQAQMLEEVLKQAAAAGEIRELRPDSTAFTVCDMTRGVIVQRLLGWSRAELNDDIQHLIGLIWRGIAA